MKKTLIAIAAAIALSAGYAAFSQVAIPPAAKSGDNASSAAMSEAEMKFKTLLTKATLDGRWCPITGGQLGPEKEDKYNIESVNKTGDDKWTVSAHVAFGGNDMVVPVPVEVKWAGDTPVLMVNNLSMPGSPASYTARVLFFGNTYSGTWSSGAHGGLLHGLVTHDTNSPAEIH